MTSSRISAVLHKVLPSRCRSSREIRASSAEYTYAIVSEMEQIKEEKVGPFVRPRRAQSHFELFSALASHREAS